MSHFNNDLSDKIDFLKKIVKMEKDFKDIVTFNYPKYEEIGVSHDIWMKNVNEVEAHLEALLDSQPFPSEYPLIHLRREDKDTSGRVIRVYFDIFGKTTLVKLARNFLSNAENTYVNKNMMASSKGQEITKKMQGVLIPIPDPTKLKETVETYLKSKNIDPNKVKVIYSDFPPESNSGPLDLDGLDDEGVNHVLMPNQNPEDYN